METETGMENEDSLADSLSQFVPTFLILQVFSLGAPFILGSLKVTLIFHWSTIIPLLNFCQKKLPHITNTDRTAYYIV